MNHDRSKTLQQISRDLEAIEQTLTIVAEEEQAALENLPESLQYSEKGETMIENVEDLENMADEIGNIREILLEI